MLSFLLIFGTTLISFLVAIYFFRSLLFPPPPPHVWAKPLKQEPNAPWRRVHPLPPPSYPKKYWCRCKDGDLCEPRATSGPVSGTGTLSTLYEVFWDNVRSYPDSKMYGSRTVLSTKQHHDKKTLLYELSPYVWHSYAEAGETVSKLACGMRAVMEKVGNDAPGELIGFYCDTCAEWNLMANACFSQAFTPVTVYANIGLAGISHAFSQTQVRVLFTHCDLLPSVKELSASAGSALRYVIYTGEKPNQELVAGLKENKVELCSFEELQKIGEQLTIPHRPPQPRDTAFIIFTSGTTGVPKGVMLTHTNIIAGIIGSTHVAMVGQLPEDTYLAYLPLAHIFEIMSEYTMMAARVPIGFASPRTLSDLFVFNCKGDMRELRPTIMCAVPAVLERLRKGILSNIHSKSIFMRGIFKIALKLKIKCIEADRDQLFPRLACAILDRLIFKKISASIGGRMARIVQGGAPMSLETKKFLIACFSCPIMTGYGLTECASVASFSHIDDYRFERTGPPCCVCDIKLIDVPEMQYTSASKPYPCGEIALRGHQVTPGYYKMAEENAAAFCSDGYFRTGDIGRWHPDGALEVIDRKKNVVKLACGEYLPLEKVETTYARSTFVENICLVADGTRDVVLAIVVPSKSRVEGLLNKKFESNSPEYRKACTEPALISAVKASLDHAADESELTRIERVHKIILVADEWTPESGMLTSAMKLKRAAVIERYHDEIQKCYSA